VVKSASKAAEITGDNTDEWTVRPPHMSGRQGSAKGVMRMSESTALDGSGQ